YFDYIHLDQVLEHVIDPRALVGRLRNWLRPDGVLCIAVPQGSGTRRALRNWRREFARPAMGKLVSVVPLLHLNCFCHANLRRLAEAGGLRSLKPPGPASRRMLALPAGGRAGWKAFAPLFSLRSNWSTRVFFRRVTP